MFCYKRTIKWTLLDYWSCYYCEWKTENIKWRYWHLCFLFTLNFVSWFIILTFVSQCRIVLLHSILYCSVFYLILHYSSCLHSRYLTFLFTFVILFFLFIFYLNFTFSLSSPDYGFGSPIIFYVHIF